MKNNKKIKTSFIIAAAVLLVAVGVGIGYFVYFNKEKIYPIPSTEEELRTVMTAGGFEVSYEMLRYFANNFKKEMEAGEPGIWSAGEGLADNITELENAIRGAVRGVGAVVTLCREYNISIDEPEIQARLQSDIEEIVNEYGGFKEYQDNLVYNHLTDNLFRFLWGLDICEGELQNLMYDLGIIDESEEAVMAAIGGDDFVRIMHIFVEKTPGRDERTARAKIDEAFNKLKAGEDFNSIIGRYSEDFNMTQNGYYYTRGEMEPELEDAAFALGIDEFSEVIETYKGYHIIKRTEKDPAYIMNHYNELRIQYLTAGFYRIVEETKEKINITANSYYDSIDLLNMK